MPFATAADGTRLWWDARGSGDPLLLVSGQAGDHTMWDPVAEELADHHRVVLFDHRGTGDSDKPTEPAYSTQGFAQDAVAVLDAAGIERAHAYGISMGGRICQWLGISHADRVGALVLGATTPGDAHGVARPARVDAVMTAPLTPETGRALLELMFTPAWIEANQGSLTPPPVIPAHARALHYAASQAHDTWDRLGEITAPVLLLHGTDDEVNVPANSDLLAERIPHAELHLLPGARHGYAVEHRDVATPLVLEFLARNRSTLRNL